MRKSASINWKWLIQEHANAKAGWKHINHVLQNRSLVPWFPWVHHLPTSLLCPGAGNTVWSKNAGTNEGSRIGFGLALSYLGGRNPARRETCRRQWGSELHMRSWSRRSAWSWDFMCKRPETDPTQRQCKGAPCTRKAAWPIPALYIVYWIRLSAIHDIFTPFDSVKVLIKERKQPREKSLSTALLIRWRTVKGPMWALPWWMGQEQVQAQHKLLSISTCPPGSGWLGKTTAIRLFHLTGEPPQPCNKETTVVVCSPLLRTKH